MTITSSLRFLYIFGESGLLCVVVQAKGLRLRLVWAVQLGSSGRCLASAGLVCWVKGQASATGEPRDKYRAAPETKAFARTILRAGDRPTARPRCSMLSEQPQHRTTSLPAPAPAPAAWPQWTNSASADRQLRTPWPLK